MKTYVNQSLNRCETFGSPPLTTEETVETIFCRASSSGTCHSGTSKGMSICACVCVRVVCDCTSILCLCLCR